MIICKKMVKSEAKIQSEIVTWYRNNNLGTSNIIFSVPNHKAGNSATGQMEGASDLILIHRQIVYFIEVKVPKQIDTDCTVYQVGRQSDKQKIFEAKVKANGLNYYLHYSLEDFINFIVSIEN